MPRALTEWRSDNPDAMPPPRVRLRIFRAYGGICQLTGKKIEAGDKWCLDHRVAIVNDGANDEANLWPVLESAHRVKTAADVAEKAKVDARAKKHLGIKGAPSSLSGPDHATKREIKDARSKSRIAPGKPPVPAPRMPRGFVSAGSGRR